MNHVYNRDEQFNLCFLQNVRSRLEWGYEERQSHLYPAWKPWNTKNLLRKIRCEAILVDRCHLFGVDTSRASAIAQGTLVRAMLVSYYGKSLDSIFRRHRCSQELCLRGPVECRRRKVRGAEGVERGGVRSFTIQLGGTPLFAEIKPFNIKLPKLARLMTLLILMTAHISNAIG